MLIELTERIRRYLCPGVLPLPAAWAGRRERLREAARRAMAEVPGSMPLSTRLESPEAYHELCRHRREVLLALIGTEPGPEHAARAADFLCAICEEPDWNGAPIAPDSYTVELGAAETALLLTAVLSVFRRQLPEALREWVRAQLRLRVLQPVQLRRVSLSEGTGSCPIVVACDVALTVLVSGLEDERNDRVLHSCLSALDSRITRGQTVLTPYTERLAEADALTCFAVLLHRLTDGAVDIRDRIPTDDTLDELYYSWITQGSFVDPACETALPEVSGASLFRVGEAAGDEAIMALGAALDRERPIPPTTILGRLFERARSDAMESFRKRPSKLTRAVLSDHRLMTARMPGLFCAMSIGGGRANAGDIELYEEDRRLLCGPNVPVLAGISQWTPPVMPEADFKQQGEQDILSMDLTGAYPKRAGVASYQRTLIVMRSERALRLVENLAFERSGTALFRFVCAVPPELSGDRARIGGLSLHWEGPLRARLDRSRNTLEFETTSDVRGGMFVFTLAPQGI